MILHRSYYKIRIILIFSIFTTALVIIASRVSYLFVKDLYLDQLKDQVKNSSGLIASQIDPAYLNILQLGSPTKTTQTYFQNIFNAYISVNKNCQLFIFDKSFKILVHSDKTYKTGIVEPRLLINKKEILDLNSHQSTTSLPFKGDDNNWYMWGFYRLTNSYWLCIRESAYRLEKVEGLSKTFWYLGITGVIIAIILSWFVARSISKPVDSLVKFSSDIGKGNLMIHAPSELKGEMLILSQALEKMKNGLLINQKEKENMLAQIAHEIRNPLGGIELLANLIREDLIKDNRNIDYADRIVKELNGLKFLISAYLNYSRPAPANPTWINIKEILSEVENLIYDKLHNKQIELTSENLLKNIYFDEEHLKHVLINLITNGIESIQQDGKINIATAKKKNKWEISVEDNGKGINAEDSNKIFEPFYTSRKDGTGLGLSISKKLCAENNAELIYERKNGLTIFKIIKEVINEG